MTSVLLAALIAATLLAALGFTPGVAFVVDIRMASWDYTRPDGRLASGGISASLPGAVDEPARAVLPSGFAGRLGGALASAWARLSTRRRRLDGR